MSILATLGPALISGGVGLYKQRQQRKAQERATQEQEFAHRQGMVQDRLSQNPIPNYTPTFQKGGNLPNYDYKRAKELGYGPDSTGHWPSRDTETGRILKAPHHPTFQKTIAQDRAAGYTPMMDERGNVYTISPHDLPRSGKFAPSGRNLPQKQMGGQVAPPQDQAQFIDHQEGQSHSGPDGGIPVDERGQPTASSGAPEVALTEKGEVTFNGYVYSDDLKLPGNKKRTFADEAKRLKNKHKLHLGEDLEKTDKIAYNALARELKELKDIQEAKKGEMVSKEEAEMMAQEAAQMGPEQQMAQQGEVPMEGGQSPMDPGMMQQEQGLPMMQKGGDLSSESRWLPESEVTADRGDIYRRGVRNRSLETSTPSINFEQKDLSGHPRIAHELPIGEGKWGHVNRSPRIGDELPIGDGRWGHVNSTQDTQGGEWREAQAQMPWANMAASLIPGLVGLARHEPTERLNLPRTRMPRANLEHLRAGARQQGRTALATGRRAGARTGATGAQMLSGTGTTAANVARGVGDAYREATVQEQQMNMQAIGQERQMNMQTAQQERMANWQTKQRDKQRKEALIASMARVPQQGMADYQRQRDTLAALNMQGPMQIQERYDPNQSRLRRAFQRPERSVRPNPLYDPKIHS